MRLHARRGRLLCSAATGASPARSTSSPGLRRVPPGRGGVRRYKGAIRNATGGPESQPTRPRLTDTRTAIRCLLVAAMIVGLCALLPKPAAARSGRVIQGMRGADRLTGSSGDDIVFG